MASLLGVSLAGLPLFPSNTPAFSNFTLDQSTDAWEQIFQQPVADTITHVGFRYGLRALTCPAYKISLQGVTTGGLPDGTILGGGTPASHVFTPPADTTWDGTWQWQALDNSIALTRGQLVSAVIKYDSGTVDGTNNSSFTTTFNNLSARGGFPYVISNNNAVRTRSANWPVMALKSATAVYHVPVQSFTQTQYSSDSTPDEYAFAFTLPAGSCTTYQVAGVRLWEAANAGAGKTLVINLYTGTTVLQTVTFRADDFVVAGATADRTLTYWFQDSSLTSLSPGTQYRIGFQAQQTASNWAITTMDVAAAGDLGAYALGTAGYLSTRTDAGAWTDVTTSRPMVDLVLGDITATAGGGGMLVHPGMQGGMRG